MGKKQPAPSEETQNQVLNNLAALPNEHSDFGPAGAKIFTVKFGGPADETLRTVAILLDHAIEIMRDRPAEDGIPEGVKHALDHIIEQSQVAVQSVLNNFPKA